MAALVFSLGGQWLIALAVEQRLLPSSVVNDEVKDRAEAMEAQQGYAPGRKQLKELRERVTEELMPRAFTRRRTTFVWIDPQNGWFCVDASSPGKAEEVIEHLRHCLDEFPLTMLHTAAFADFGDGRLAGRRRRPGRFHHRPRLRTESRGEEKAPCATSVTR
jgi:recombination associated protein RdgC